MDNHLNKFILPVKQFTRQEIGENYLNQPKPQIDYNSIMIIDYVYSNDNIDKNVTSRDRFTDIHKDYTRTEN